MAKEKTLSTLPYGEGTMRWRDDRQTQVCYRKCIKVYGKSVRLFVTASTPAEAMKLMRKKETSESNRLAIENKRKITFLILVLLGLQT